MQRYYELGVHTLSEGELIGRYATQAECKEKALKHLAQNKAGKWKEYEIYAYNVSGDTATVFAEGSLWGEISGKKIKWHKY